VLLTAGLGGGEEGIVARGPTIVPARLRALAVSAALLAGSTAGIASGQVVAMAGSTWQVQAGNVDSVPPPSLYPISQEHTTFYPARNIVHENDDVVFTGVGQHTVTFNLLRIPGVPTFAYADPGFGGFGGDTLQATNQDGGATLNSGGFGCFGACGPGETSSFTLHIAAGTAGKSGTTYHFLCALHRDMSGTLTVLPSKVTLPSSDVSNQQRAKAFERADITRATQTAARTALAAERRGGIAAGVGQASVQGLGAAAVLRFLPATITISPGQSVTFINEDINAPHTVTFGPELPDPTGFPGFLPYGGNVVSAQDQSVNSGFLVSQELVDYANFGGLLPPGFVVRRTVTFTFTSPGTYHYICALHDELGMQGDVVVEGG
jgi:plastocyanin